MSSASLPDDDGLPIGAVYLLVSGLIESVIAAEERIIDLEDRLRAAGVVLSGAGGELPHPPRPTHDS